MTIKYEEVKEYIEGVEGNGCKLLTAKDNYKDVTEKLNLQCQCGNLFQASFTKFKNRNKKQCNDCGNMKSGNRKTKDLNIPSFDYINDYVKNNSDCKLLTIKSDFLNFNQKIKFKCKCGTLFKTSFSNFKYKNKRQCDSCGNKNIGLKLRKSHEEFVTQVENINREFIILSQYVNAITEVTIKHTKCDHSFSISPNEFLNFPKCRVCEVECNKNNYKCILHKNCGNKYEILGDYKGVHTPIKIKHNKCGNVWDCGLSNLFRYYKDKDICPVCSPASFGEEIIYTYLTEHNIFFEQQYRFKDCKNIFPLRFDFAIFKNKEKTKLLMLVEYDGELHYEPARFIKDKNKAEEKFKRQCENDIIKDQYCYKNNIKLLRIPYTKLNNLTEILDDNLKQYEEVI